jgi:hypothetical protein
MNDRELHDLFAERRPDRDAFAAGVAARLRARGEGPAPDTVDLADAGRLPRAAGVAPLDLGLGSIASGALGKSFWAWLSLPVLLLAGAFAAFVGGVFALRRTDDAAPPTGDGKPGVRRGPAAILLLGLAPLPFVLMVAYGSDALVDAILLSVLLSMLGLTVALRRGAQLVGADRRSVATVCMHMLHGVWFGGGFVVMASFFVQQEALYKGVAGLVMVATMVLLAPFAMPRSWPIAVLAVATLLLLVREPFGPVRETAADVTAAVREGANEADDMLGWQWASHATEALRGCGVEPVDAALRERAIALLQLDDPHPTLITAAARLAHPTAAEWQPMVMQKTAKRDLDRLPDRDRRLFVAAYDEWQLEALLATRDVRDEVRKHLAATAHATWPTPDQDRCLAETYVLTRWLVLLGREAELTSHRDAVHEALRRRQCNAATFGSGGFRDFLQPEIGATEETTHHALALLRTFGAPDGIDMPALHGYLQRQVRNAFHVPANWPHALVARADLLWFEHSYGPQPRSWQRFVVDERLPIGIALLALLCLIATFQAPSRRPVAGAVP